MPNNIITKLYKFLGHAQLNTAVNSILSQNHVVPVYLFFMISTIFICYQGSIGTNMSELLTMWSGEEIRHQNWVMNTYSEDF